MRDAKKTLDAAIALSDDDLLLVSGGKGKPDHAGPKDGKGGPPWYQPAVIQVGAIVQIAGDGSTQVIDF